jgi:hypothetical protein
MLKPAYVRPNLSGIPALVGFTMIFATLLNELTGVSGAPSLAGFTVNFATPLNELTGVSGIPSLTLLPCILSHHFRQR